MNNLKNILIIEDDLLSRITLEQKLKSRGNLFVATSTEETKAKIKDRLYDIALVDLDLDRELEGLSLISKLKEKKIYTVVLTSREEEDVIAKSYQSGCDDYLVKPFNNNSLDLIFKKFEQKDLKCSLKKMLLDRFIISEQGNDTQIDLISQSLLSSRPIFIQGETGTGKTYLAKIIHELSGQHLPFVQINCSEFSEGLLESELFGHQKGSFTGAIRNKKGLLELADGGILFLDEIATMSANLQKKLLKAIEEKEFYPVGSENKVKSNFRLISATCENLKEKISKSEFRQDLYFRIEGFNIELIPLRRRRIDIINLVNYFMKKGERRFVLDATAKEYLTNYNWPGNIRELENIVEILRLQEKGIITEDDLSSKLMEQAKVGFGNFEVDWNLIQAEGLTKYLENIEMLILNTAYNRNLKKVRKTMSELKIANNSFYRIMENIKTKGLNGSL